jgi:hypothetical protein
VSDKLLEAAKKFLAIYDEITDSVLAERLGSRSDTETRKDANEAMAELRIAALRQAARPTAPEAGKAVDDGDRASPAAISGEGCGADVLATGQFLIDRLENYECDIAEDDHIRQYCGHVAPALARFKAAVSAAPPDGVTEAQLAEAELSTLRSRCETLGRELATVTETLSLKFFAAQTELISANERVHYAEGTASANIDRASAAESARDEAVRENERLKAALAFADEQAAKVESLIEPHIKWDDKS